MREPGDIPVEIRKLKGFDEARQCARVMAGSEPWITLDRNFEDSLSVFTDSTREVYVAEVEDQLVGFVVLVMRGSFVGYVQSLGVWPDWRGQGIGRRLMQYAEARVFSESPNLFVCASSFNPGARRLYENLGYQQIGELVDYIVPGQSEILYRKTVAPISQFRPPGTKPIGPADV
jgi:ribosomal protein S18 acetylase RimI-like enzyme